MLRSVLHLLMIGLGLTCLSLDLRRSQRGILFLITVVPPWFFLPSSNDIFPAASLLYLVGWLVFFGLGLCHQQRPSAVAPFLLASFLVILSFIVYLFTPGTKAVFPSAAKIGAVANPSGTSPLSTANRTKKPKATTPKPAQNLKQKAPSSTSGTVATSATKPQFPSVIAKLMKVQNIWYVRATGKAASGTWAWFLGVGDKVQKTLPLQWGLLHGLEEEFYLDGKLQRTTVWKDGKREGPESWYHERGWLKARVPWQANLRHGKALFFRVDGSIERSLTFKDGKKDGDEQTFDPQGRIIEIKLWQDGQRI